MNQRCCIKCLSKEIIVLHVKMQPRLSVDFCCAALCSTLSKLGTQGGMKLSFAMHLPINAARSCHPATRNR